MICHIILSFYRLFYNLVDYVFLRRSFFERFFFLFGAYLCSIKDSLDSMTGRLTEVDLSEVPPGPRSLLNYSLRALLPLGDWPVINVQVKKGK